MGKFLILKRSNGEYQFNLKANNGQTILSSEGYYSKSACQNGIESVRTNSQQNSRFDRKISSNGKFYFNLKASNGQIIGTSEMYENENVRDNGISSVTENAPTATIEDQAN